MITAKPGQREKILEVFRANVPACRAEDGCIEYGATIDAEDAPGFATRFGPDTFVVVEKWASVAALEAHAAAPHMAAYAARVKEYIAARAVHVLSPT
jgi:quinol monooxygenase YgiN